MFIVTGASGKLGSLIVEALKRLVPAHQISLSVRNPEKLPERLAAGVRVRRGDYNDADSLRHAWAGAKRLLLVSSNAGASGDNPLSQHEKAISVAKEIGIERVLYTSQVSSNPLSHFPPGRDHAATEAMLAESGLASTSLRHGFYADSILSMHEHGFATGTLTGPEDGKVAWVTHEDLAEADARLLSGHETIEGITPPLTGNHALDLADLAQMASAVTGRTIERQIIGEDMMLESLHRAGLSGNVLEIIIGYYRAAKAGEFETVDPTLSRILGRDPRQIPDFLSEKMPRT